MHGSSLKLRSNVCRARQPRYDFVLSNSECRSLTDKLAQVKISPYTDYNLFKATIKEIQEKHGIPTGLKNFRAAFAASKPEKRPFWFGKNCPIDGDLPILNWDHPVEDKRQNKKTFIGEGFLCFVAEMLGMPAVAHRSVNDGDFFHDIAPKRSMAETQSQKTIKTLKFHKDFTSHFAQPDYVLQVVLRNDPINEVYSTYASDEEVILSLPASIKDTLRQNIFYTPYDDISLQAGHVKLGTAGNHAILEKSDTKLRVFEGRTIAQSDRGEEALNQLVATIHRYKYSNIPEPGDFVLIRNNYALHGKEVVHVHNEHLLQRRWVIKTHNVSCINDFERFFEKKAYGIIDG